MLYAIYDRTSNKVVSRFLGEEHEIPYFFDTEKLGYIQTSHQEFSGDPTEYSVDMETYSVARKNIQDIIAKIESRNPLFSQLRGLREENALLYSAIAELSILIGGGS